MSRKKFFCNENQKRAFKKKLISIICGSSLRCFKTNIIYVLYDNYTLLLNDLKRDVINFQL